MKKKCIVHIGMHKTGTTSIQRALSGLIDGDTYNYTKVDVQPVENNHNRVFSILFKTDPYSYHGNVSIGWGKTKVDEYAEMAERSVVSSFINRGVGVIELISGEDIGYLNRDEMIRLRCFLEKYFETVEVVAYIRSPISYINSAVQEVIKHGACSFDFQAAKPNYNRFMEFIDVFGQQNVHYRSYDLLSDNGISVISDFFSFLKIPIRARQESDYDNISLSLEAVSFLYVYQKFSNRHHDVNYFECQNKLIGSLSTLNGQRMMLHHELIESFLIDDSESLCTLNDKFNLQFNLSFGESALGLIRKEDDLIECAVKNIDRLKAHLVMCGIRFEAYNQDELAVAKLVRLLDEKINGEKLASDFSL